MLSLFTNFKVGIEKGRERERESEKKREREIERMRERQRKRQRQTGKNWSTVHCFNRLIKRGTAPGERAPSRVRTFVCVHDCVGGWG